MGLALIAYAWLGLGQMLTSRKPEIGWEIPLDSQLEILSKKSY